MKKMGDYYELFSHIYIEKDILSHPRVKQIISHFPDAKLIIINHYKDVFCRTHQDFHEQKQAKQLILAAKQHQLLYQGAPVCQSFGNEYFYYTSSMMNCLYDCEYCYLQGMYASANVVVFVNIEDIFKEVKALLLKHPVYLCVSYDTDIAAFEGIIGHTALWVSFEEECRQQADLNELKIEIRTKSAQTHLWESLQPSKNVIIAYTLSPERIIEAYEHGTPSLKERLESARTALDCGFSVRLCFDPMIYCNDWEKAYDELLTYTCENILMDEIQDVSIGTFRVSEDYLKRMRKQAPESAVVQFPYVNGNGVYHYPDALLQEMTNHMKNKLMEIIPENKIFSWES
jgi:spore photoproduct lyase